jgi:hypothetical protein
VQAPARAAAWNPRAFRVLTLTTLAGRARHRCRAPAATDSSQTPGLIALGSSHGDGTVRRCVGGEAVEGRAVPARALGWLRYVIHAGHAGQPGAHGVSQGRDYLKSGLPRFGSLAVSKPQDW